MNTTGVKGMETNTEIHMPQTSGKSPPAHSFARQATGRVAESPGSQQSGQSTTAVLRVLSEKETEKEECCAGALRVSWCMPGALIQG